MKKLVLKAQELGSAEILTRKQLKNVLGGLGDPTTTVNCPFCSSADDCNDGTHCPDCLATGNEKNPGKCGKI